MPFEEQHEGWDGRVGRCWAACEWGGVARLQGAAWQNVFNVNKAHSNITRVTELSKVEQSGSILQT